MWTEFRAAVTDFVQLFGAARRSDLHARLTGTAAAFDELTGLLAADRSGLEEWRSFHEARDLHEEGRITGLPDRIVLS